MAPSASRRPLRKGQLCGWSFAAAARTTVAAWAARAMFAVATLARSCVDPFGHTLTKTSNTLVGFFLGQVTSNNMFLDMGALGLNDGVNDGFDGNTLVSSNISNALASLAGCLQYVFANT